VYSVDAPAGAMGGWFSWLRALWLPTPRYWYTLRVTDPETGVPFWLGPQQMTEREATEWQIDTMERYWGYQVTRSVWNGQDWVYG